MNRLFSVRRRRPHIVDIYVPRAPGVTGFLFKWAPTFSGTWTDLIPVTTMGYRDPNVAPGVIESQPSNGEVRVVFDPESFGIPDDLTFWLVLVPMSGTTAGIPSAATIVLPDRLHHGQGLVVIRGSAPNTPVLQLDLPTMADLHITNEGTVALLVGSEELGPTTPIVAGSTMQLSTFGPVGTLYLAGNGSAVNFSATFTTRIK